MPTFNSSGLIGGPRTTTVNTIGGLTAVGMESQQLEGELQILKLKQALARAKSGQPAAPTGDSPAALQAARLQATAQQQANTAGLQRDLQTQRLQVGQGQQAAQLAAQLQQLQTRQAGDRTIQGDRLQSTERMTAAQLAAQMQRLNTDIQGKKDLQAGDIAGKKDLQTNASTLEEKRKKDSAARALALFRAAPGGGLGTLNTKAAAAELG